MRDARTPLPTAPFASDARRTHPHAGLRAASSVAIDRGARCRFSVRVIAGLSFCVSLSMSACTTPPEAAPRVTTPAHYANAPATASGWKANVPANGQPLGPWWQVFGDTGLDALEAKVDVSNQSVQQAVAQLQQARAQVDYQRAGFFPTVAAGTGVQRFRTSQNVVDRSLAGKTVPDYSAGMTASWEPDLFGRIRASTANATASAEASAADLDAVRLAVTAELAQDYMDLRSVDTQKHLLDASVDADAAALKLLQQQLNDGAIDASAVAQAQTQLESTRTRDADLDVTRAHLQHAIATLIGEPASSFVLPPATTAFAVPDIPAGLPSELLERRPDIAAAARRVAAANASIGVARAAFFPDLVLSAGAGLESTFYSPWLTAPSLFWSLGPQLAGTLFDGGRRNASLRVASAQYAGTVADYRQTVLVSLQQVEDNLAALHTLATESASEARAVAAANLSLTLTTNRFDAGAVSYLDVVTSQTIALSNQLQAQDIRQRQLDASIALLKALGGPWAATGASAASAATAATARSSVSRCGDQDRGTASHGRTQCAF